MKRAIFLDRDGVLNRPTGKPHSYINRLSDFVLLPGVEDSIRRIRDMGYLAIVVTNQAGLGKGHTPRDEYERINARLISLGIDAVYTCPHDSGSGCDCRKPEPGLLLRAAREHGIDLENSWMIGDSESDAQAGRSAGCMTYTLSGREGLSSAVEAISGQAFKQA